VPNTLAHFAVQGLGSRCVCSRIDLKWVFLGCVIPDIPWVILRILGFLTGSISYEFVLHASVQASLAYCVLLSMVFALLSERPRLIFLVLAVNALAHLLLDALEIKWGNGVHLFAPFNWELLRLGLVWPDSRFIGIMSLLGLVVGIWALVGKAATPIRIQFISARVLAAGVLLSIYFISPIFLLDGPYSSDVQSIATLKEKEQRAGKTLKADRWPYEHRSDGDFVIARSGETLQIVDGLRATSSLVSFTGRFVSINEIRIDQLHEYHSNWRDLASYLGLGLIILVWARALLREKQGW